MSRRRRSGSSVTADLCTAIVAVVVIIVVEFPKEFLVLVVIFLVQVGAVIVVAILVFGYFSDMTRLDDGVGDGSCGVKALFGRARKLAIGGDVR